MKNLASFLRLGYFLDYENKNISINVSNIDKKNYANMSEEELVEYGLKMWTNSVSSNFQTNEKHLVPISGGLDSRAILAAILRFSEAKNIFTYTYGTPKTLDFEIGSFIAKKLGTNHVSFDLTKCNFTQDELEDVSKRSDFQTILFHHPPTWEIDKRFKGMVNWSGFMGDSISGSKFPKNQSDTIDEAKKQFIKKNMYVSSFDLTNNIDFSDLIQCKPISKDDLTFEEQLDFQNRQLKFIHPIVLIRDYDYKMPFLHQDWIDFMLSVPGKYRVNQNLYKKILLFGFPKEFSYKTKSNFGLPLSASKYDIFFHKLKNKIIRNLRLSNSLKIANVNYLDFDGQIREKKDLQKIISQNIHDLKTRNIIDWIDIEMILKNHLNKNGNFANALVVLASLEIHLKSGLRLELK